MWKERTEPKTTVNVINEMIPKVFISKLAADKMDIIITESKDEVGWLCDVVAGDGADYNIKLCVEAWEARIYKHAAGDQIGVGNVDITVKPNQS